MYHCMKCGKGFEAQSSRALYCSKACRQAAYRDRKKVQKQARANTLDMWEFEAANAIVKSAKTFRPVWAAMEDLLHMVKRDKWYDVLARCYIITGAQGCENLDRWLKEYEVKREQSA